MAAGLPRHECGDYEAVALHVAGVLRALAWITLAAPLLPQAPHHHDGHDPSRCVPYHRRLEPREMRPIMRQGFKPAGVTCGLGCVARRPAAYPSSSFEAFLFSRKECQKQRGVATFCRLTGNACECSVEAPVSSASDSSETLGATQLSHWQRHFNDRAWYSYARQPGGAGSETSKTANQGSAHGAGTGNRQAQSVHCGRHSGNGTVTVTARVKHGEGADQDVSGTESEPTRTCKS